MKSQRSPGGSAKRARPRTPTYKFSKRVEVVSKTPEADAERILRGFARRAFRRTVTVEEIEPFVELVKARLVAKQSFEQAIRVGLKAVMVSPEFLFLQEKVGSASRAGLERTSGGCSGRHLVGPASRRSGVVELLR